MERKAIISRNEGTNWVPAAFTEGIVGAHGGGVWDLTQPAVGALTLGTGFARDTISKITFQEL